MSDAEVLISHHATHKIPVHSPPIYIGGNCAAPVHFSLFDSPTWLGCRMHLPKINENDENQQARITQRLCEAG